MRTQTDLRAGKLTVFGVDSCGWTRKQLAYLDKKGIAYTYHNCDKDPCPDFVDGFPTLNMDGKILVGFQEV
jgi:hypothetical protein